MKKLLVLCLLALCLFSCGKKQTFNSVINEDYANAVVFADTNKLFFYEVQVHVANYFDEFKKAPEIDSMTVVYQIPYHVNMVMEEDSAANGIAPCVYFLSRPNIKAVPDTDVVVNDFWMGDFKMNPNDLLITYERAFEVLYKKHCLPHTQFMTLRWPTNLSFVSEHPLYIFGHEYAVDAMTGEVIEMGCMTDSMLKSLLPDEVIADTVAMATEETGL